MPTSSPTSSATPTGSAATTGFSALTALQEHFNQHRDRPHIRDAPKLSDALLKRARNCIPRSDENNDLLEFIGDRAVNLLCAILVEEVKLSKAHHKTVSRVISNNDTFARISYCLRFHVHAELTSQDQLLIDKWDPTSSLAPPKVLADLFEAYAGAVLIQHGWKRLRVWLERIFKPVIQVCTADYWHSTSGAEIFGESSSRRKQAIQPESKTEAKLLDYIEFKRTKTKEDGQQALDMLPENTIFHFGINGRLREPDSDRVEIAIHLVNLWICQIVIKFWPEYHHAKAKAAHMLSSITGLVTSERVMAFLASVLSLSDLCQTTSTPSDSKRKASLATIARPGVTQYQKATALKATIGWMFHKNPEATETWGMTWFTPVVLRAHDILVQEHGYRPILARTRGSLEIGPSTQHVASSNQDAEDDVLSALVQGLETLHIKSKSTPPSKPAIQVSVASLSAAFASVTIVTTPASKGPPPDKASNETGLTKAPKDTPPSRWRPIDASDMQTADPSPQESSATLEATVIKHSLTTSKAQPEGKVGDVEGKENVKPVDGSVKTRSAPSKVPAPETTVPAPKAATMFLPRSVRLKTAARGALPKGGSD